MTRLENKQLQARNPSGQGIFQAISGIALIVLVSIGFLYFCVSLTMADYYKIQANFICSQAASYAFAGHTADETAAFVSSLENQMGIGTGSPKVNVSTAGSSSNVWMSDTYNVLGMQGGMFSIKLDANATATATPASNSTKAGGDTAGGTSAPTPVAMQALLPTSSAVVPVYSSDNLPPAYMNLPIKDSPSK